MQGHRAAQASAGTAQKKTEPRKPSDIPRQLLDEQQHLSPVPTDDNDSPAVVAQQQAGSAEANYSQDTTAPSNGSSPTNQPASTESRLDNLRADSSRLRNIAPISTFRNLMQL